MASATGLTSNEVDGINLEDYVLQRRNYSSAVYVHKKFLNKNQPIQEAKINKNEKKRKHDKGQQVYAPQDCNIIFKDDKTYKTHSKNDSVLDQTIKFAKTLVPLVIPPSRDKSPSHVFYTIKPTKRSKRKAKKLEDTVNRDCNEKVKRIKTKITETYRNVNKQNISNKDSTISSSNNTLNDINNQSLCCTLSESSEKNKNGISKRIENKFVISESFEALATELNGDKIKVQLMTDKDKNSLTEKLRLPIINAIKECIREFHSAEMKTEKLVQVSTQKLDVILDKLKSIESKLDIHTKTITPEIYSVKESKLELLGKDLIESNSVEELSTRFNNETEIEVINHNEELDNQGCGEVSIMKASTSVGVKANRPARLPARFCWTDTVKEK